MANDFDFTEPGYIPPSLYDFDFGEMGDFYYVLKGTSNNFNSIWVFGGRLYAGTNNCLTVLDLGSRAVYDWYSETRKGRANELLTSNDAVDINVVG